MYVRENDTETAQVAKQLAQELSKKGVEVGVESYKLSDVIETEKKELQNEIKEPRFDEEGKY